MFTHILVAMDFSKNWDSLLKVLPRFRGWGCQRISLVHVLAEDHPPKELIRYRRHYQRRLDALAAELSDESLHVQGWAFTGDPVAVITDQAVQWDVDCILAASHGHNTRREVFLGSTVLNLARLTPLPLLVVPVTEPSPVAVSLDRIVLATDGSAAAKAPEQIFMELTNQGIHGLALFATERGEPTARTRELMRIEQHLKQLVRLSTKLQLLDTRIVKGAAATVITETALQVGAHLIIIGKRGLNRLQTLLLGSTAEAVCRLAPCPVLVVPATAHLKESAPTLSSPAD